LTISLTERIQKIKLLITDVDGVHTDGSYFCGPGGEYKQFNAIDGLAFALARIAGLQVAFISGRVSEATQIRARELRIPEDLVFEGYLNKLHPYGLIKEKLKLTDAQIAYMGDDLVDQPVMEKVGFAVAVSNAQTEIRETAHYITRKAGGHGAIRECIELILKTQHRYDAALEQMQNRTYKVNG
jgi:3-deoxy-D-manno-octulosonate 8-phosphate phosphatase (KDO 8-P phosphatase)